MELSQTVNAIPLFAWIQALIASVFKGVLPFGAIVAICCG
jgi:hypothetical protein